MITETLAQTPTTCTYCGTFEVTHTVETEGGSVQGMCIVHATEYGYPEYLVSVDDVQDEEPTVEADDAETIEVEGAEVTISAAWEIFYGVNARRSQLRSGANSDAQRRNRELKKAYPSLTWKQMVSIANFVDPSRTDGLKTKERAAAYLRSIGK